MSPRFWINFWDARNWGADGEGGVEDEKEGRGERVERGEEERSGSADHKLNHPASQLCLSISIVCVIRNWNRHQEEKKKYEEVRIPSLESSPTTRHHLGLRTVKANFFEVPGEPEGKTASNPARGWNAWGLEWKCVFLQGRRGWREGQSSLNENPWTNGSPS